MTWFNRLHDVAIRSAWGRTPFIDFEDTSRADDWPKLAVSTFENWLAAGASGRTTPAELDFALVHGTPHNARMSLLAALLLLVLHIDVQSAPDANPVTDALREVAPPHFQNILKAFEGMPADKYSFKPTPQLMTFGELARHITNANNFYCSALTPDRPKPAPLPRADAGKEALLSALRTSLDYCAPVVANARDNSLSDLVTLPSGVKRTRVRLLFDLVSGMDHHYGQAASYLRLSGLVPPTAQ